MAKETRTVTIDPDVHEYLDKANVNASGLVNNLVKEYMEGSDADIAALDVQIKHKERELDSAKSEVNRVESELTELRELRNELQRETTSRMQEAADTLARTPLETDNPAIKHWSGKLNMTPGELIEEIETMREE